MADIVIVDLDAGNLYSVRRAAAAVAPGREVVVTTTADAITNAAHLILPGQAALGAWMQQLDADEKLRDAINKRLRAGPVLGICLGLQALYSRSDENGGLYGLGLLAGRVRRFKSTPTSPLKIPHMGWNQVRQTRAHPLWHNIGDGEYFYFAHSYLPVDSRSDEVAGECTYGEVFTAAAARENIFAVQFHPEKSQRGGLQLLRNFVNWNGDL